LDLYDYLGEMVRTELGLVDGKPTSLAIPRTSDEANAGLGFRLFHVERRSASSSVSAQELSVKYGNDSFVIAVDLSGERDASSRVIKILGELTALESTTNMPTSN
jgi:hypothetical protein